MLNLVNELILIKPYNYICCMVSYRSNILSATKYTVCGPPYSKKHTIFLYPILPKPYISIYTLLSIVYKSTQKPQYLLGWFLILIKELNQNQPKERSSYARAERSAVVWRRNKFFISSFMKIRIK